MEAAHATGVWIKRADGEQHHERASRGVSRVWWIDLWLSAETFALVQNLNWFRAHFHIQPLNVMSIRLYFHKLTMWQTYKQDFKVQFQKFAFVSYNEKQTFFVLFWLDLYAARIISPHRRCRLVVQICLIFIIHEVGLSVGPLFIGLAWFSPCWSCLSFIPASA